MGPEDPNEIGTLVVCGVRSFVGRTEEAEHCGSSEELEAFCFNDFMFSEGWSVIGVISSVLYAFLNVWKKVLMLESTNSNEIDKRSIMEA